MTLSLCLYVAATHALQNVYVLQENRCSMCSVRAAVQCVPCESCSVVRQSSCSMFCFQCAVPCNPWELLYVLQESNRLPHVSAPCALREQLLHMFHDSCTMRSSRASSCSICSAMYALWEQLLHVISSMCSAPRAPGEQMRHVLCSVGSKRLDAPCALGKQLLQVLWKSSRSVCSAPCAPGKYLIHVLCAICSKVGTAPSAVLNVLRDSSYSTCSAPSSGVDSSVSCALLSLSIIVHTPSVSGKKRPQFSPQNFNNCRQSFVIFGSHQPEDSFY